MSSEVSISYKRVVIKAAGLVLVLNIVFALTGSMEGLGTISAYNWFFPGRVRLPFGERPDLAYNLTLDNLPAMFASHEIHSPSKNPEEFRVVILGDSSVWGYLLPPYDTLSEKLNQSDLVSQDKRAIHVYNLGYPTISLAKDLLILNYSMQYEPDLIIWMTTLEAFPYEKQLDPPILRNNPDTVREMFEQYNLHLDTSTLPPMESIWEKTILGKRRDLADLIRLQTYGVLWSATGIDQYYPDAFEQPEENFDNDTQFYGLTPSDNLESILAFEVIQAAIEIAGETPVLIINEPIFISQGENSHIRYNFFYPRWAYDEFRVMMNKKSIESGWLYLDAWDAVPANDFTNSAIHYNKSGVDQVTQYIIAKTDWFSDLP